MINKNFIYRIINKDIKNKKYKNIITRFAPEPNGFLHIGHIKSIYLNYNIAKYYKGKFFLRFDDTNPNTEKNIYIKQIKKNIKWLGLKWNEKTKYASNYFNLYYKYAKKLINKGLAYIDEQSKEQIKINKGSFNKYGINSPYRNRNIKENLILFKNMKEGLYKEGSICLRAKINMKSNNLLLRDPILYRIKYKKHPKTKNKWCIYPTYDFAHCIADSIEKISHSICTLEFQNNRFLYKWIIKNIGVKHIPKQYEFSKLNITYNLTSKRKIKFLIKKNIINKWSDPRLLTISGLKNRGYQPKIILNFCKKLGVSKQENIIDISILEECLRKYLNKKSERRMSILNPIKINLINLNKTKKINIFKNPICPELGKRKIYLNKIIFIDKNDLKKIIKKKIKNNKKIYIKLRYAGIIKFIKTINYKDNNKCIKCKYYKYNKNFNKNKNIKIIHWISKKKSIKSKFRLFNNLFKSNNPNKTKNILNIINKNSILIKKGYIEKNISNIDNKIFQFEREGYFKLNKKFKENKIIFDRIIKLKK